MPLEKPKDGSKGGDKSTCLTEDSTDSRSRCLNGAAAQVNVCTDDLRHIMPLKSTINLDLLSEELQRQTKETLKLKEEVEQATMLALERMGCKVTNTEMSANQVPATNGASEISQEYGIQSHQSFICPLNWGVDVNIARSPSAPGKDVLERIIEEYSLQVLDLQRQLRESGELHDQQKFHFWKSIIELQAKLQESQVEKDALSDLRIKGSRKQSELTLQLESAFKELHVLKQTEGQKLIKAEDKLNIFIRRAETMEQMLQDIYRRLSDHERRTGRTCYVYCDGDFSPDRLPLGPPVEKALRDLENENHSLQERLQLTEEQLKSLEEQGQGMTESLLEEQKARRVQLITSHDQQVEMLTRKLASSQTRACTLQLQVEESQKKIESLTSLHQSQISDLESVLSKLRSDQLENQTHKAKVSVLEEALTQARSQAEQIQTERDLAQHQAKELDGQICRFRTELHQMAEELSVKRQQLLEKDMNQSLTIQNLRQELERRGQEVQQLESIIQSLRQQCQRHLDMQMSADTKLQEACKELSELHQEVQSLQQAKDKAMRLHEQSVFEAKHLQALLENQQQEALQAWSRLEEERVLMQGLRAEVEILKLKLEDREKCTGILRRPLEALQQDKSNLSKQLKQFQLDNQQLRAVLQEAEFRLSAAEQEKLQQQAALSEGTHSLQQLEVEKQQVTAELEMQRTKLVQLKEEQEVLRELHSRKTEELQEQNSRLKVQLQNIRNDLDQAKISLRALGGADGHGLKVALGMQKQITAKRQQLDFFQSRVQMLQETTEKLAQEKRYQVMKSKRQAQELIFERDRRKRLETELEAHQTNEKHLKSEAERLDTALHKMSDSFAECQEFIQKQEQEIMRMKLQHALELKEGQNLQATKARSYETNQSIIQRSPVSSPTLPAQLPVFPTNMKEFNFSSQNCCPTPEPQSLAKGLHNAFSEEHIPYINLSIRRSEQTHRRSEQGRLQTTDLDIQDVFSALSPDNEEMGRRTDGPQYRLPSCVVELGRRSPVHSLLTSDLPTDIHYRLKTKSPASIDQSWAIKQDEQQSKLECLQDMVEDLQIKKRGRSKAGNSVSQNCPR